MIGQPREQERLGRERGGDRPGCAKPDVGDPANVAPERKREQDSDGREGSEEHQLTAASAGVGVRPCGR